VKGNDEATWRDLPYSDADLARDIAFPFKAERPRRRTERHGKRHLMARWLLSCVLSADEGRISAHCSLAGVFGLTTPCHGPRSVMSKQVKGNSLTVWRKRPRQISMTDETKAYCLFLRLNQSDVRQRLESPSIPDLVLEQQSGPGVRWP